MKRQVRAASAAILIALPGTALMLIPIAALGDAAAPRQLGGTRHPGEPALHRHYVQTQTPIKHFVFLMQGGRTFDNYFGTYPGATGIPAHACQRIVIDRPKGGCVRPFLARGMSQPSLGATRAVIAKQYDGGKMDGFVAAYASQGRDGSAAMGHYSAKELPFYWAVADNYVLFDHFFTSALYGTRANRYYWIAAAPRQTRMQFTGPRRQLTIFDRLQAAGISWKFYVQHYDSHQRFRAHTPTNLSAQTARVPLLSYPRFIKSRQLRSHIVDLDQYYRDLRSGTLPAVAFIASAPGSNERSARTILAGQQVVRTLITQLMLSRSWSSSALMWSYDGSGGFYDHVVPPRAGPARLGFRVPALLVSPYARHGQVNHTVLGYASALAFIENNWHLARLTRVDATAHGLDSAFNFTAGPRPPDIIPTPLSQGGIKEPRIPKPPATAVYETYGGALVLALMLMASAVASSARSARRVSGASQ